MLKCGLPLQFELSRFCAFYQTLRRVTCNTIERKTHDIIGAPVWCKEATSIKNSFLLRLLKEIVVSPSVLLRYIHKRDLLRTPQASLTLQLSLKVSKCVYNPMYWLTHKATCNSTKHVREPTNRSAHNSLKLLELPFKSPTSNIDSFDISKRICDTLWPYLRWLKTVSSTFQDVDFNGPLLPLFISWCYNHSIKKLPNHW